MKRHAHAAASLALMVCALVWARNGGESFWAVAGQGTLAGLALGAASSSGGEK